MNPRPWRPPVTPQRVRALRDALHRAQSVGPFSIPAVVGMGSGFAASFIVDALLFDVVRTPWRQFIDAAAFTMVAAPVWLAVQRSDVRGAHEVLTWLNGWETERWQAELGRRLPGLPRAAPQLLDRLPDTMGLRPLRVELLAVRGDLADARERLARLPTDTPWQRFEQAALAEWISWLADGPELLVPMRSAAPAIEDEEGVLVARAMIATAEARRAAVSGGDAIAPLAEIRRALGARPGRYAFGYRTGILVSVALVGLVASLAVAIASAVIR